MKNIIKINKYKENKILKTRKKIPVNVNIYDDILNDLMGIAK